MSRAIVGSPEWTAKYRLSDEQRDLVAANTGLAYAAVVRYLGWIVEIIGLEETDSLALDALCHAAACFDPSLGFAFSTYATDCVRKIVLRDFRRNQALISVPDRLHRPPKPGEKPLPHAKEAAKVRRVFRIDRTPHNPHDGRGPQQGSRIDPPAREEPHECDISDDLDQFLRRLDARSRLILSWHFETDGRTLREIGKELRISYERVRQIEAEAIDKLRECFGLELRSPKRVRRVKSGHAGRSPMPRA